MEVKKKEIIRHKATQHIDQIFSLQQERRSVVNNSSAETRIDKLKSLSSWIESNQLLIRDALYADFRKPAPEVDLQEIYATLAELRYAIKNLKRWMKPIRVRRMIQIPTASARIQFRPRGVVLIITPWNFPFMLSVNALISAIAAGNCIMLKPSEYSPHTSSLLRKIVQENFPPGEISVIEGGKQIAGELLTKPFNHIFFTGSSDVGKIIMQKAASHLSSVTLELGGKSPAIIDETAHLSDAVRKIVWGKFMNAGQTCVAPDYLCVHENRYQETIHALKKEVEKAYGSGEAERKKSNDFARIIDQRHFSRLKQLILEACQSGGQCEIGRVFDEAEKYVAPTIISQPSLKTAVMKEEIFGPVLPVIPYKNLEELLEVINKNPIPLAVYIFSENEQNIQYIRKSTVAGGTVVNDVIIQFLHNRLPFGGVNHSGIGNTHGYFGFKAFSNENIFLKNNRFSPLKLFYPPYTSWKRQLIKILLRFF